MKETPLFDAMPLTLKDITKVFLGASLITSMLAIVVMNYVVYLDKNGWFIFSRGVKREDIKKLFAESPVQFSGHFTDGNFSINLNNIYMPYKEIYNKEVCVKKKSAIIVYVGCDVQRPPAQLVNCRQPDGLSDFD